MNRLVSWHHHGARICSSIEDLWQGPIFWSKKIVKFWRQNVMPWFAIIPKEWQSGFAVSWILVLSSNHPLCFLLHKPRSLPLLKGLKKSRVLVRFFLFVDTVFDIIKTYAISVIWPNHLPIGILRRQKHSYVKIYLINN